MTARQLQRLLHLAARATGDARAARRGPAPLARRVIRRQATRALLRGLR